MTEFDGKALSRRIRWRRRDLGFTSAEAAKLLNVSLANWSLIENSQPPKSIERIFELARILECSAEWLLSGKGEIPKSWAQREAELEAVGSAMGE